MAIFEAGWGPHVIPSGVRDLQRFENLASQGSPFTFIRFSDGEIEILRNRKLIIAGGITEFRGISFVVNFLK